MGSPPPARRCQLLPADDPASKALVQIANGGDASLGQNNAVLLICLSRIWRGIWELQGLKSLGAKGKKVVSSDSLEKWHFPVIPGRCHRWRTDLKA